MNNAEYGTSLPSPSGDYFFNWQGVRGGGVIITATSERFPSGDYFFNWHSRWLPDDGRRETWMGSHQGIIFLTGPVFETADIY